MTVSWHSTEDPDTLNSSLDELLGGELTASLAVVDAGRARACTVYFAAPSAHVYFTSQAVTKHVLAVAAAPGASLAIWSRPAVWGDPLHGVQFFGECREVGSEAEAESGLTALRGRFPGVAETLASPADVFGDARKTCLLRFTIDSGTLIDEVRLGKRNFVEFTPNGAQA